MDLKLIVESIEEKYTDSKKHTKTGQVTIAYRLEKGDTPEGLSIVVEREKSYVRVSGRGPVVGKSFTFNNPNRLSLRDSTWSTTTNYSDVETVINRRQAITRQFAEEINSAIKEALPWVQKLKDEYDEISSQVTAAVESVGVLPKTIVDVRDEDPLYTVTDLNEALTGVGKDVPVYVWIDGDRHEVKGAQVDTVCGTEIFELEVDGE